MNESKARSTLRAMGKRMAGDENPAASLETNSSAGRSWPTMHPAALHGLAGDIVRTIEPHSESDPVAILLSLLTAFGCAVGRSARFRVESTDHYANTFALLVADTGRGRKGTSWGHVKRLLIEVDSDFVRGGIISGLGSGEVLIQEVRDAREILGKDGEVASVEQGVQDKRRLVLASEFSSVLRVAGRRDSILSEILREAWDYGDLKNLVKGAPLRATGAHISLLGHITREELLYRMTEIDIANGLANRILIAAVRRSKTLPNGGSLEDASLRPLVSRLREALEAARSIDFMRRNAEATDIWGRVYPVLTCELPGMLGHLCARAEAQTLRLSMIYALLDASPVIRSEHLAAALSVWDYCEQGLRMIFGDRTGNPMADAILRAIRERGELSRTDIDDLGSGHWRRKQVDPAIECLERARLIVPHSSQTGGHPRESWTATERGERGESPLFPLIPLPSSATAGAKVVL